MAGRAVEAAAKERVVVEYASKEPSAFAEMLGGLIGANVTARPEKKRDFDTLVARVGIWVTDIDEGVTLAFDAGPHDHDPRGSGNGHEPQQPEDRALRHARLLRQGRPRRCGQARARQAEDRRHASKHRDSQPRHPDLLRPVTQLAVIGAGSMGAQIAQQAALHGVDVRLQDKNAEQLKKALESNRGHVMRRVEKGKLGQAEADLALSRVRTATDLAEAVAGADFVIEAVFEDLQLKRSVFAELDEAAPPETVLASNSSTMGISKIADATSRPERCVNVHFFYPVLVMDLVEVVRGPQTSDDTVERAMAMVREMGRTAVLVNKEIDGFIVNRILHAATQEAYRLLDAGVASFQDIDTAVEKGLNWPMGPFRLGDFSGLDVTYNARLHMYKTTGDERYRPSPQLEAKVKAGKLGRKSGEGWYSY